MEQGNGDQGDDPLKYGDVGPNPDVVLGPVGLQKLEYHGQESVKGGVGQVGHNHGGHGVPVDGGRPLQELEQGHDCRLNKTPTIRGL